VPDKTYVVRLKGAGIPFQQVRAAAVEVHEEHLAFLDAQGQLAALFLMAKVESWNEIAS
jgi:hypothetical protein